MADTHDIDVDVTGMTDGRRLRGRPDDARPGFVVEVGACARGLGREAGCECVGR